MRKIEKKDEVFEVLLASCKNALQRFVYYKMKTRQEGEDVLQEVYLTAYEKLDTLKDHTKFKSWILTIAANKCMDAYRARNKVLELPLEELTTYEQTFMRAGRSVKELVDETLVELATKEQEILFLYYIKSESQAEIAKKLDIPIGTVKSRLYHAKKQFREKYPYPPQSKGEKNMMRLPKVMPEVKVVFKSAEPFEVTCEESFGWFIVPRIGEKRQWGFYDYPERTLTSYTEAQVTRKATINGIDCVEMESMAYDEKGEEIGPYVEYMCLKEDAIQAIAEWHLEDGVKKFYTFLDEHFLEHFGWGEDNYGFPIHLTTNPEIKLVGEEIVYTQVESLGLVGRYDVTINHKTYDTVRYVLIEDGMLAEKYIDQNGRTVLWRRYNKDDWKMDVFQEPWSQKLSHNLQIKVNGETYIHWYDCITDYVL
ncbi:MAG: RNA polymerase sigma factor [Cellulosilyticaceae bacterium]